MLLLLCRNRLRIASLIIGQSLLRPTKVTQRKGVRLDRRIKFQFQIPDHRFFARFTGRDQCHYRRHFPSAKVGDFSEHQLSNLAALFIKILFRNREKVAFPDLYQKSCPDNGYIPFRLRLKVEPSRLGIRWCNHLESIVLQQCEFPDQIIVGKIRTHPGAHHHGGWNFDHLPDLGEIIPHFRFDP